MVRVPTLNVTVWLWLEVVNGALFRIGEVPTALLAVTPTSYVAP